VGACHVAGQLVTCPSSLRTLTSPRGTQEVSVALEMRQRCAHSFDRAQDVVVDQRQQVLGFAGRHRCQVDPPPVEPATYLGIQCSRPHPDFEVVDGARQAQRAALPAGSQVLDRLRVRTCVHRRTPASSSSRNAP
jgi:hypothetical protein